MKKIFSIVVLASVALSLIIFISPGFSATKKVSKTATVVKNPEVPRSAPVIALLDIYQDPNNNSDKAKVLVISVNYKGSVILKAGKKSASVSISPKEAKYINYIFKPVVGDVLYVTAGGYTQKIPVNQSAFRAFDDAGTTAKHMEKIEKGSILTDHYVFDDNTRFFLHEKEKYYKGDIGVFHITPNIKDSGFVIPGKDTVWLAVLYKNSAKISDDDGVLNIIRQSPKDNQKYYVSGINLDADYNMVGGFGGEIPYVYDKSGSIKEVRLYDPTINWEREKKFTACQQVMDALKAKGIEFTTVKKDKGSAIFEELKAKGLISATNEAAIDMLPENREVYNLKNKLISMELARIESRKMFYDELEKGFAMVAMSLFSMFTKEGKDMKSEVFYSYPFAIIVTAQHKADFANFEKAIKAIMPDIKVYDKKKK